MSKERGEVGGFSGHITGIANFNGKVIVLTSEAVYELKPKKAPWYTRLWRWLTHRNPEGQHDDMLMSAMLGSFVKREVK